MTREEAVARLEYAKKRLAEVSEKDRESRWYWEREVKALEHSLRERRGKWDRERPRQAV